jgi:hypothetical protein|tara:strand:- start:54 stop:416 length:363 start_codon:yes stop_codon:yes gene_type:complete
MENVIEKAPSILERIKDARREARRQVKESATRSYPFIKTDGWVIATAIKGDTDRHHEYYEGPVTMRVIRDAIECAVKDYGEDAVVWIEGRYDYATHINTSDENYDYEPGEYWEVDLLNSL